MSSDTPPQIALCPRCFCPLDIRRSYSVDFCLPARPPLPPNVPPNQNPINQHSATETAASSTPSAPSQNGTPAPPYEPPTLSQLQEHEADQVAHDESRRSSSSSFDSAFTQFSINTEFAAELTAVETTYFSQRPSQQSCPPPPSMSSPSTESSLTLSATLTSSPSVGSLPTPPAPNEPLPTMRRWVVFRGRVPGIYGSS